MACMYTNYCRYYFDKDKKSCQPFTYSGCKGNANNFHELKDCQEKCQESEDQEKAGASGSGGDGDEDGGDICRQPEAAGPCRAYVERYFFDGKKCSVFIYGGCGGNGNNFVNKDECHRICQHHMDAKSKAF
jgi:hypothetical protein